MMNRKIREKLSITETILAIMAIAQFAAIIYFNYTKADGLLGMDSAFALRHAVEMWKNGIFLNNFSYFSTLEIDCVGFFTAPIYMATGNLGLAMALCHGVSYFCMAGILCDITKNLKGSLSQFLLMVLFIFTPYSVWELDWTDMMYMSVAQYGFRVMLLLLMFDLMLICGQEKINRNKLLAVMTLFCVLNFWTSMSVGNYVLCMIILPISLGYILSCVQQRRFKLFSWSNLVIVLAFIVSYAGYVIRVQYAGESHRNDMQMIVSSEFAYNLESAINGVMRLFGGAAIQKGVSVFSETGIEIILKFAFIVFCGATVVRTLCKDKLKSNIFIYMFAVFMVDFGILLVMDTTYGYEVFEHRYHILWGAMFLITAAYALGDVKSWGDEVMNRMVTVVLIAVVVLMNVLGFRTLDYVDENNGDSGYEKAIISVADQENVNSIFIYDAVETTSVIRILDLEKYCAMISYSTGVLRVDSNDFYIPYADNSASKGANIMVCPSAAYGSMPEYVQNAYTLIDDHTFGGDMCVYRAEHSIWDGIAGLPLTGESLAIDFPYTTGYEYKGTINEEGCLVIDSSERGYVFWGPKVAANAGTYNITIEYRITEAVEENAFFDVATDSGERTLIRETLPNDATSHTLEQVEITGTAPLEFRVFKPEGSMIEIERLVFERVK